METMERTLIGTLEHNLGKVVKINGWVHILRIQKKMQFLVIRDYSGMVQAIHERQGDGDQIEQTIDRLTLESIVEIIGTVIANPQVKLRGLDFVIKEIKVMNFAEAQIPIDKDSGLEHRLNWRFLDLRRPENFLIFQVQTAIEYAMRCYWQKHGFIEIHSPKLMGSASESGGELFRVKYFDRYAYLAQSPQFYKQMAMAAGFDKVFEIGPVFRANPSFTSRHDTEFTSIDVEISWIASHKDIMKFEEHWLRHVLQIIKDEYGDAIQKTFGLEIVIPRLPFPRLTVKEAEDIIVQQGHKLTPEGDLDPEGERLIAAFIKKKFGHEFVFVTDYPVSVRPFYHMRYADMPDITKSFDLIWKGLEITTGAQREHRYDILVQQAREKGLKLEPIQYYLDFFKFGCPPHGGFGFGLTRMLMLIFGLKNVREVTYLYRGPNRLFP